MAWVYQGLGQYDVDTLGIDTSGVPLASGTVVPGATEEAAYNLLPLPGLDEVYSDFSSTVAPAVAAVTPPTDFTPPWGLLALVLAGIVGIAAMSGGKKGR